MLRPLVGVRFQVLFHPSIRCFSPFLHGTCSLSVFQGVFSLGGWSPIFRQDFHVSRPTHLSSMYAFRLRGYHPLWLFFPEHSSKHIKTFGLWANPLSLATTYGISFDFFSSGYLDVSVLRVCSHCWVTCLQHAGLPHSDICGSIRVCQSPQLFAAYHVLRRL